MVFAALMLLLAAQPTLAASNWTYKGFLVDISTCQPIAGATMSVNGAAINVTSSTGAFSLQLQPGNWTIMISKQGYGVVPSPTPSGAPGQTIARNLGLQSTNTSVNCPQYGFTSGTSQGGGGTAPAPQSNGGGSGLTVGGLVLLLILLIAVAVYFAKPRGKKVRSKRGRRRR